MFTARRILWKKSATSARPSCKPGDSSWARPDFNGATHRRQIGAPQVEDGRTRQCPCGSQQGSFLTQETPSAQKGRRVRAVSPRQPRVVVARQRPPPTAAASVTETSRKTTSRPQAMSGDASATESGKLTRQYSWKPTVDVYVLTEAWEKPHSHRRRCQHQPSAVPLG